MNFLGPTRIELDFFGMQDPGLTSGSGYRSKKHNQELRDNPPPGAGKPSLTSHHMDGTAADVTLTGPVSPAYQVPPQCEVLVQADYLIGGKGEVLDEGHVSTVHIAVPGKTNRDYNVHSWKCEP